MACKRVIARCWSLRDWRRLSAEVSALAGGKDYSQVLGFADPGGGAVDLGPAVCGYLDLLALGGHPSAVGRTGLYFGIALNALAHEAEHARGVVSEAKAQCYAIQMIPSVGERLGLSAAAARRLTDAVWHVYRQTKRAYWSRACRADGPYDLHLHDPAWP